MNAHDSEKLEGMLLEMGMVKAQSREEADFVIFNTCCVRENAQRRALSNVVWLKELKKTRPELMVAVCGCMMQQPGMGEQILRQYPFVDVAFVTHNLYRFAQLMLQAVKSRRRVATRSTAGKEDGGELDPPPLLSLLFALVLGICFPFRVFVLSGLLLPFKDFFHHQGKRQFRQFPHNQAPILPLCYMAFRFRVKTSIPGFETAR